MPTASGNETFAEARARIRADLARVRAAIGRTENNGASFSMGGVTVSSIAYERLQEREAKLLNELSSLALRQSGRASGKFSIAISTK